MLTDVKQLQSLSGFIIFFFSIWITSKHPDKVSIVSLHGIYTHVYTYIHIHTHIYTHTYINTDTYTHTHIHTYTQIYTYRHIHKHHTWTYFYILTAAHTRAYTNTPIHTLTNRHTHTHAYVQTHTHTHTQYTHTYTPSLYLSDDYVKPLSVYLSQCLSMSSHACFYATISGGLASCVVGLYTPVCYGSDGATMAGRLRGC